MLRTPRSSTGDRGQSTVEFALILPLLIIGVLLIVQAGHLVLVEIRVEHAAREGARAAAAEPASALTLATDAVARVDPTASVAVDVGARWVTVDVRREVAVIPGLNIGARTATADVTMRREDVGTRVGG